ncbi:hypothetical protein Cob_v001191 [Colletotrichum orbiculare MAFF 240422]|uniref:Uncharacterized protein n=1 Tax=Colletotrichum orbiculare (strain 104-T / ATCC 96160 / CBS 514.97 / LARS 414 / MAFF 240422) TaxID=1213857 RepID=A0A484G680_COLOR|nr:hypothetical protein Cob_v001191 [Colletotrichum orbiculare MAFF 240422]
MNESIDLMKTSPGAIELVLDQQQHTTFAMEQRAPPRRMEDKLWGITSSAFLFPLPWLSHELRLNVSRILQSKMMASYEESPLRYLSSSPQGNSTTQSPHTFCESSRFAFVVGSGLLPFSKAAEGKTMFEVSVFYCENYSLAPFFLWLHLSTAYLAPPCTCIHNVSLMGSDCWWRLSKAQPSAPGCHDAI